MRRRRLEHTTIENDNCHKEDIDGYSGFVGSLRNCAFFFYEKRNCAVAQSK